MRDKGPRDGNFNFRPIPQFRSTKEKQKWETGITYKLIASMFRSFKKYFRELNYFLKVTRVAIWHEYLTRLIPLKEKETQ